jgi:mono/diheme cytochrome c family protein
MLKRKTGVWLRSSEANATPTVAGEQVTQRTTSALVIALLVALAFLGSARAGAATPASENKAAESTFKAQCAMCHGQDGSSNTPTGRSLKIPDFRSAEVQGKSDAELAQVIAKGTSQMPAFKNDLSNDQIHTLVGYVRNLAKEANMP